ncbi:telomeric repeat binding factor (NIMA-interacting) 1 L homeolog [Xenopus laevis]|uniref:Telomeric repeat-binding factor n=1 Tax=Xenopus laevis TaxID=8355 RepID=Q71E47_XENLA|nr:telomeric repeat binding factor (NIMA-interacting) 1 L homeolog [Xenopus laevis]AAQ08949.2 telomeric repeat binding factor 1 [Xenopus laevis]
MEEETDGPPFDDTAAVATNWMCDFMFASMCFYFREDRTEDFQRSTHMLEWLLEGSQKLDAHRKTIPIAQFLMRVAEGKNLDSQFDTDESLTPLETALMAFNQIEEEEDLKHLHEEIELLLKVQAVVTCMEKGRFKLSAEILDRLFKESGSNKYLRMKLTMLIEKKDPYHEFLQNFTYAQMMKKIKSYIALKMKERPSVFLLKAAAKVVEATAKEELDIQSQESEDCEQQTNESLENKDDNSSSEYEERDVLSLSNINHVENKEDISSSDYEEAAEQLKVCNRDINQNELTNTTNIQETTEKSTKRHQRRLFSIAQRTPWNPDKPCTSKRLLSSINIGKNSKENQENVKDSRTEKPLNSKKRQHWTWEEDELLKKGVRKFGVGNWSKILLHYEFRNRTGVMLKDRWRTMKRLKIVDSDCDL